MYDYLIVGAGFFGATFARVMTDAGKSCLVIDRRTHIGGNAYTENKNGVDVHVYGPHMFHTNSEKIWNFVNKFSEFLPYEHKLKAYGTDGILYSMPFTMHTFEEVWGITDPDEARAKIESQRPNLGRKPKNLEEQAIQMVGTEIYELLIKEYTRKQWNADPKDLPASIIRRLPLRFDWNDSYFGDDHKFMGIPKFGYTKLFEKMLEGIDIQLGIEYNVSSIEPKAKKIVFSGGIDQFFNYCYGELEYRSLRFEHEDHDVDEYQDRAIVNYCSDDHPYTRVMEHKWFTGAKTKGTLITKEYPQDWKRGVDPYYPINNDRNKELYRKYAELAKQHPNIIFGGRLGEYQYYDMHQVIGSALSKANKEIEDHVYTQ